MTVDPAGTLTVGGAADFDATANIVFGSIVAGTGFTANAGGDILFTAAGTNDNNLTFVAGRDLIGVSASSFAAPGSGGDDSVSLTAGRTLRLTGASQSENNFLVGAADIDLGSVDAARGGSGAFSAIAGNLATVAQLTTSGAAGATIQGAAVTLGDAAIGGNLRLNATAGDVNGTGTIGVGGAADFDATGNIVFGSITAGTGFTADAGGDIRFTAARTSDNNLVFAAGGDISGVTASALAPNGSGGDDSVSLTAGGDLTLTGASRAENSFTVRGADIDIAAVNAALGGAGTIDIRATGAASVGTATTGGSASALIEGTSVALDNGAIGGNLRLNATAGDVNGTGTILVGGAADFDATGNILFGSIAAGTGFTANAGGDIGFVDAATSDNNLVFVAGGDITGNSASNLALNGSGGDDSVSLTAGGDVTLTGTSRSENNFTIRAGNVTLGILDGATGGAGAIDVQGTGAVDIVTVTTGGNAAALIQGASVALDSGAIGGDLRLNATGGDIGSGGAITVGGAADLDATGAITVGGITAGTGFTADAGTDILFGEVSTADGNLVFAAGRDIIGSSASNLAPAGSGGDDSVSLVAGRDVVLSGASQAENDYSVTAGGTIAGGDFLAGNGLMLNGGSISIGTADAQAIGFTSGGDILFDQLTSTNAVDLAAVNGTIGANAGTGDIDSGGDVTLLAQTIALDDVTSGGSVDALATEGDAAFGVVDAAGEIAITATGTPSLAGAISGGDTSITGASVALANGTVGGDLVLTSTAGDIDANGALVVGGGIALSASGDIAFGTLAAQGGDFTAGAGGTIAFADAFASGALDFGAGGAISGGNLVAGSGIALAAGADLVAGTLAADGAISGVAGGTLTVQSAVAGDALDLRAGSTLTIADAIGGTVTLRSAEGAVIVTRDIESTFTGDGQWVIVSGVAVQIDDINDLTLTLVQATDGDIDATAAGDIGIVAAESAGDINLTSSGGDVRVTLAEAGKVGIVPAGASGAIGPAEIEFGNPGSGAITVSAAGLAQGRFVASGDIAIDAGSDINLDGADAGGSIRLDAGGSTRVFGTAAAGADIAIQSGGDVRVTNSGASLEAGEDLTVEAGGVFDTQGFAYGASVAITAADVVIGSSGRIGDGALTQSITFTNTGDTMFIGGAAVEDAFSLDADEFGRIRGAGDLSIFARGGSGQEAGGLTTASHSGSTGGGDIVVRDLEVTAGSGGSIGIGGTLLLDAEGEISVTGTLAVTGGGEETRIRLDAGDLVWLDTAGGNLRIENGDGEATGLIDIRSNRFIAASEDALADLEGLSAAEIDARLAQNDGVVRDEGFLQAGTLQVQVQDAFLVQNSGEGEDFDQRRGFAVDILSVEGSEGSDPLLVINGTVGGLTGTQALAAADLTSGLDPASTFNGCVIANPASCVAPPEAPGIDFTDPARDLIEEEFEPGLDAESLDGDLESQLIDLSQPEEFEDDPLIDDPVTGAGNEDLWTGEPECEPDEEGEGLCPAGEADESEAEAEAEPAL